MEAPVTLPVLVQFSILPPLLLSPAIPPAKSSPFTSPLFEQSLTVLPLFQPTMPPKALSTTVIVIVPEASLLVAIPCPNGLTPVTLPENEHFSIRPVPRSSDSVLESASERLTCPTTLLAQPTIPPMPVPNPPTEAEEEQLIIFESFAAQPTAPPT